MWYGYVLQLAFGAVSSFEFVMRFVGEWRMCKDVVMNLYDGSCLIKVVNLVLHFLPFLMEVGKSVNNVSVTWPHHFTLYCKPNSSHDERPNNSASHSWSFLGISLRLPCFPVSCSESEKCVSRLQGNTLFIIISIFSSRLHLYCVLSSRLMCAEATGCLTLTLSWSCQA